MKNYHKPGMLSMYSRTVVHFLDENGHPATRTTDLYIGMIAYKVMRFWDGMYRTSFELLDDHGFVMFTGDVNDLHATSRKIWGDSNYAELDYFVVHELYV